MKIAVHRAGLLPKHLHANRPIKGGRAPRQASANIRGGQEARALVSLHRRLNGAFMAGVREAVVLSCRHQRHLIEGGAEYYCA